MKPSHHLLPLVFDVTLGNVCINFSSRLSVPNLVTEMNFESFLFEGFAFLNKFTRENFCLQKHLGYHC